MKQIALPISSIGIIYCFTSIITPDDAVVYINPKVHQKKLPKLLEIRQYSCGALATFCHKASALLHDSESFEIPINQTVFIWSR